MSDWFSNLPGVIMTEHELTQGIARVQERSKVVEIEPWVRERSGTMTFYREDAEVLRFIADALESFDVARPEVEDEDEEEEKEGAEAAIEMPPARKLAAAATHPVSVSESSPAAGRQERLVGLAAGAD